MATKYWLSKDGIKIPHSSSPERAEYDKKHLRAVADEFTNGDVSRLRATKIKASDFANSALVYSKPRFSLYKRMLAAGEPLPHVVVEASGPSHYLIDGSHRVAAALDRGVGELDAYEVVPSGVKKSEELDKTVLDPNAGYTITHEVESVPATTHKWKGHQPAHKLIKILATHGGKIVGSVHLDKLLDNATDISAFHTFIEPEHRRKGLASAMYSHAEKVTGLKMKPSSYQSQEGRALWGGNVGNPQFGKSDPPDTSFDFGYNVVPQDESQADPHTEGRQVIARMRHPEKKKMAEDFLAYVTGQLPKKPAIEPSLERHLARFGIVDPQGYKFDESGRSMARKLPGRRVRGEEPEELKRLRLLDWEHSGFLKSEELGKGSLQSKFPYNPALDTSDTERFATDKWQTFADDEYRQAIPRLEGNGRLRALHKLHTKAESRRSPTTGKREFLLHRGMGVRELDTVQGNRVINPKLSSWTTNPEIATEFGARGQVVSAWIPEDSIHHVLNQIGNVADAGAAVYHGHKPVPGRTVAHPTDPSQIPRSIGSPYFKKEHEVLVKLPDGAEVHSSVDGKIARNTPIKDLSKLFIGKSEDELSKAISQIKPGIQVPDEDNKSKFDYSHLLTPEHQKNGYSLHLTHDPADHELVAEVKHNNRWIGSTNATFHPNNKAVHFETSEVRNLKPEQTESGMAEQHRGTGLGKAMYSALMAHGLHFLGADKVSGREHSTDAMHIHQSLAKLHGHDYKPQLNPFAPEDRPAGPYDAKYGEYQYAIKSDLNKAIDPNHTKAVARYHTENGNDFVDHSHDVTNQAHPFKAEFTEKIINSPQVQKRAKTGTRESSNSTGKVVYQHGSDRYMLKPYHEKVTPRLKAWHHAPIMGWAEMTNQALYRAGGIGHLHQNVDVVEAPIKNKDGTTANVPMLAIKMDNNTKKIPTPYYSGPDPSVTPEMQDHARKIGLMDFLSNNLDRHHDNLLMDPKNNKLLAIDHSRSFQYKNNDKDKKPKYAQLVDSLEKYISGAKTSPQGYLIPGSAVNHVDPLPEKSFNRNDPSYWKEFDRKWDGFNAKWNQTFDWWTSNRDNIVKVMNERLAHIKDESMRNHIKENFESRVKLLNDFADHGIENFGRDDWFKTGVDITPKK